MTFQCLSIETTNVKNREKINKFLIVFLKNRHRKNSGNAIFHLQLIFESQ